MTVQRVLRPGTSLGVYPQRLEHPQGELQRLCRRCWGRMRESLSGRRYRVDYVARRVDRAGAGLRSLGEPDLARCAVDVRETLLLEGLNQKRIFQSLALLRELSERTLGMRPYDVQLFSAWVITRGGMAEMATGEGKSLAAAIAAGTGAMAGIPVHVITTNEYLAQRDAEAMRPLYAALGLSVKAVRERMDTEEKQQAYCCDVVYVTNKQVAFDYLRDRLVSGNASGPLSIRFSDANLDSRLLMRGLCFAIVDEADSVLIDEARTPLLLSKEHRDQDKEAVYRQALDFARAMREREHYIWDARSQRLTITDEGADRLLEQLEPLDGVWAARRHALHLVQQALCALHQFERDTHYLVRDGAVVIIDRNTGRRMADRSWQHGLQQMIECKEACDLTGQRETLASISYQRFFRRYMHLSGLSGTLQPVKAEMRGVYDQSVIAVPTHRRCRRLDTGFYLHRRAMDKWLAVLAEIEAMHAQGRPVLVGTQTVGDSRLLDSLLTRRRLPHRVLNAQQDEHEAQVVAKAGQLRQITVATNMAGRGTDIKLGAGVAELGGLHVIVTDCHDEQRVDRQLYGRCARQGDPGSVSTHLCLADPLLRRYPAWLRRGVGALMGERSVIEGRWSRQIVALAQRYWSARYRRERQDVMHSEERSLDLLAYTGQQE